MEGYGTDCYLTLNKMADENTESLIASEYSEEDGASALRGAAAALDEPNYASGLFDAQGRRPEAPQKRKRDKES